MPSTLEVVFRVHEPTKNIEIAEHAIRYEMRPVPIPENATPEQRAALEGKEERHVLERLIHRRVLCPGDDLTGMGPTITAAAKEAWTPEVIAERQARIAAAAAQED